MSETAKSITDKVYLQAIETMLREIQFGSITITIQDGKIVQVEKNEKIRWKN